MVNAVWRPLIEATRRRHLKFRRELEQAEQGAAKRGNSVVPAGV
jgi:F0F1-type ATP synthase membrane subunit b/b'